MDIRKLTIEERNNPFIMLKNNLTNGEIDFLQRKSFNARPETLDELESVVILMNTLNKKTSFINNIVMLSNIKENSDYFLVDSVLTDLEVELNKYNENEMLLLKEKLSDSQSLIGYDFNENIDQTRNCASILINDYKTLGNQIEKSQDFEDIKIKFQNKKSLMTSLVLILKYNDINDAQDLNLENEVEILSSVLSNDKYKSMTINTQIESVALKKEEKISKPKQENKYRPKLKRRMVMPKPS